MNGLSPAARRDRQFSVERNDQGMFPMLAVKMCGSSGLVVFQKRETEIEVYQGNELVFEVVPEWDEASSSCRLKIGDCELEVWQVSQKALSTLFFESFEFLR